MYHKCYTYILYSDEILFEKKFLPGAFIYLLFHPYDSPFQL